MGTTPTKVTNNKKYLNLTKMLDVHLNAIKLAVSRIEQKATEKFVDMILDATEVFITGQGRSGFIVRCFATRLTQMGFQVHIPGQATCRKIEPDDLLIAISCSGRTTTTTELARISREVGSKIAVITAVNNSPLAKMADETIIIPSNSPDIRKACPCVVGPNNNTVFEEAALVYSDIMVYMILEKKGLPKDLIRKSHTNLE